MVAPDPHRDPFDRMLIAQVQRRRSGDQFPRPLVWRISGLAGLLAAYRQALRRRGGTG
jgi:hypothetical protein